MLHRNNLPTLTKDNKIMNITKLKRGSTILLSTDDSRRAWKVLIMHNTSKGVYITAESIADYDIHNQYDYGTPLPRKLISANQIESFYN